MDYDCFSILGKHYPLHQQYSSISRTPWPCPCSPLRLDLALRHLIVIVIVLSQQTCTRLHPHSFNFSPFTCQSFPSLPSTIFIVPFGIVKRQSRSHGIRMDGCCMNTLLQMQLQIQGRVNGQKLTYIHLSSERCLHVLENDKAKNSWYQRSLGLFLQIDSSWLSITCHQTVFPSSVFPPLSCLVPLSYVAFPVVIFSSPTSQPWYSTF